jgi:hypothetical protein
MSTVKKVLASAGTITVALGALLTAASAASASTPVCTTTGPLAGSCGDQVNTYGNGWDVKWQLARVNEPIIAYPDFSGSTQITNDPATDFYTVNTTPANSDERVFEYAPNGVKSGLCVSDPVGGVAGDSRDGLVLRVCNGSKFQQFTGLGNTQNTAGLQWKNLASGQIVQPNGTSAQLSTVATVANRTGSYWGWNSPGVVPGA